MIVFYVLEKQPNNSPIRIQSRKFTSVHIAWDRNRFNNTCENAEFINPAIQKKDYWVKRDPEGDNKRDEYSYFVVLSEGHGMDQGKAFVIGTKKGKCKLGRSPRQEDKDCGFQEELLKQCFNDRGKKAAGKGFDPTSSSNGRNKWSDQKVAKLARKHCNSIIHFELNGPQDALMATAHAIAAAQQANIDGEHEINMVFSDKKAGMEKMFIKKSKELAILFPDDRTQMEQKLAKPEDMEKMKKLLEKINDLFFCSWNKNEETEKAKLIATSDPATNVFYDAVKAVMQPPMPVPKFPTPNP